MNNDGSALLSYAAWLELPQITRTKLAVLFEIPKNGESVVHVGAMIGGNISGMQKSDGYTPHDLAAVSLIKMQELLHSKDDNFYALFRRVVENVDELCGIEPEEAKPIEAIKAAEPSAEFVPRDPDELIKKKPGRPKKA